MLHRIGYFVSDLAYWLRSHLGRAPLALVALAALGAAGYGGYLGVKALTDAGNTGPAPAPKVIVRQPSEPPEATADLGFPAFATRNTTRVSGSDPVTDAAGVALAAFPSTGGVEGPPAVTLVDQADWPGALAASSLVADPVHAPILLTDDGEIPKITANALRSLAPSGSAATGNREVFQIGAAAAPPGARTEHLDGDNPAAVAAAIADQRDKLAGEPPEAIVVASSDDAGFAMPAASWAARSGDPVLFVQRQSVPAPTAKAISKRKGVAVYVLGPATAISNRVLNQLDKLSGRAKRVGDDDPVSNAVAFARYSDGNFGWNINDPGHGFVIANVSRPTDAGAAAALSASGTWGPLLLTEAAAEAPPDLAGYLLDLKPGYEDDPTRAVYNHIWVIGDESAVSVDFQAQVDELAEVAPIASSRGSVLGPAPGTPETETRSTGKAKPKPKPKPKASRKQTKKRTRK